jgi:hypothetical protein
MSRMPSGRLAVLFVAVCLPAFAGAAQRTFVRSDGVDNPSCSLAAPCRGFAAAVTAASAGGEVIVLDAAGYGPVSITKAISLIAPSGIYAGISVFTGNGVTINAPGSTVVLRGLTINGQGGGPGVNIMAADRVRIENCVISNMSSNGLLHTANGAQLIIVDTIVRDSSGTGIGIAADSTSVLLDHVRSERNGFDGFYIATATSSGDAVATISNSVFADNGANGVWAQQASSTSQYVDIQVEGSTLANNGNDGFKASGNGGSMNIMVGKSAIHSNVGSGIEVVLGGGGTIRGVVVDNRISANYGGLQGQIHVSGVNAVLKVSSNAIDSGSYSLVQANGAALVTLQNNVGNAFNSGTILVGAGF